MTDAKLTTIEQAMTWERMSGERLSDTERARIMQGGDFHPPTGTTLDPDLRLDPPTAHTRAMG